MTFLKYEHVHLTIKFTKVQNGIKIKSNSMYKYRKKNPKKIGSTYWAQVTVPRL
jgi:hypothetical protein